MTPNIFHTHTHSAHTQREHREETKSVIKLNKNKFKEKVWNVDLFTSSRCVVLCCVLKSCFRKRDRERETDHFITYSRSSLLSYSNGTKFDQCTLFLYGIRFLYRFLRSLLVPFLQRNTERDMARKTKRLIKFKLPENLHRNFIKWIIMHNLIRLFGSFESFGIIKTFNE